MALDPASKLGAMLGALSVGQDTLSENISADDEAGLQQLFSSSAIALHATSIVNQYTLPTDSFVIDHPVYGYIDSPVLKIDGGYQTYLLTIPVTIPIVLGAIVTELARTIY